MKKTLFYAVIIALVTLSCGQPKEAEIKPTETAKAPEPFLVDLSPQGLNVTIAIPDSLKNKVKMEKSSGILIIQAGENFKMCITENTVNEGEVSDARAKEDIKEYRNGEREK